MRAIRCLRQRRSLGWLTVSTCAVAFTVWLQPATAHHSFAPALTEDGEEVIEIFEGSIEIY
jgi:hypothetical protein